MIEDLKPEAFLIGATNIGRDLGPRCAARLHTGLCADCTHLDVDVPNYIQFLRESSTLDVDSMKWDMEDRNLKMTRPAFGGHLMATIICPRFRPCMATVRPGVMKKNAFDEAKANAVEIVKPNFSLTAEDIHTDVTEVVKAAKKLVDLIGADYIVSVGRGIIIVIGLEVDLAAVLEERAVVDELAGVGQAVLVGRAVLAPRVAEVDVDAADLVLRRDHALDALNVGAHDLDVVDGAVCGLIGGLDLALGQDEHLVGDVDAQIVVLRVGAGQLGDEAALAAAQLLSLIHI